MFHKTKKVPGRDVTPDPDYTISPTMFVGQEEKCVMNQEFKYSGEKGDLCFLETLSSLRTSKVIA
jgi:hypothetical protein